MITVVDYVSFCFRQTRPFVENIWKFWITANGFFWTDFTHCSGISSVDFEQLNVDWDFVQN